MTASFGENPFTPPKFLAVRTASGLDWPRFGSNLVVVELATAVVLLISAGLFTRSFYRLLEVDPGFQPHNLAIVSRSAPREHYPEALQRIALERQILDRVSALPGVSSVAITGKLPIGDGDGTSSIAILGHEHPGERNEVAWRPVSTGYFKTLGARLLRGRYFTDADVEPNHPHVAIIDRELARKYFVGLNPVGMRINFAGGKTEEIMQIVGLIDDVGEGQLDSEARCAFYLPYENRPFPFFSLVARPGVPAENLLPMITTALRRIDPFVATFGVATMEDRIHDSQPAYLYRASTWLAGTVAVVAVLLSVVGL